MIGLIAYAVMAVLVGLVTWIEQANRYSRVWGVRLDDVLMGGMAGCLAGALWPLTIIAFLLMSHDRPNTALMCRLTGGHDWQPIGGIPFRGVKGVCPSGHQSLWCMRCPTKKYVWPWGDEKFGPDETFGYRR